jgi:hypothetical protein
MFDFSRLFSWSYWFSLTPPPMTDTVAWSAFIVFALLVLGGVVLRVLARRKPESPWREIWARTGRASIMMGCLALLLLFFAFERVRLFGSHFWYLLWLVGLLVWLGCVFHYTTHVLPKIKVQEAQARERAKYLPTRKRARK